MTDKQLDTALATAAAGFETWQRKTFAERAVVVATAAAIMQAHIDEFARPVTPRWVRSLRRPRAKWRLAGV
jgi:succinate-semialdehyde dehydrogenase / glutarate-semialdehyde dehydrogenase